MTLKIPFLVFRDGPVETRDMMAYPITRQILRSRTSITLSRARTAGSNQFYDVVQLGNVELRSCGKFLTQPQRSPKRGKQQILYLTEIPVVVCVYGCVRKKNGKFVSFLVGIPRENNCSRMSSIFSSGHAPAKFPKELSFGTLKGAQQRIL